MQTILRSRVIIINDGKIFCVKHSKDSPYWALPGGKMEGSESPLECIKREIKEELDVMIEKEPELVYVCRWFNEKKNEDNLEFIFLIEDDKNFLELKNENGTHAFEIVEMKYFSRDEDFVLLPEIIKQDFKENKIEKDKVKFI
jgi:ADP-ribose pyrophosphatase YjhB (NUDIX family)